MRRSRHAPAPALLAVAALALAPASAAARPLPVTQPPRMGGQDPAALPATPGARSPRRRLLHPTILPSEEYTVILPGNVTLDLVRITGGTPFMMGAPPGERGGAWESPQHQVTIARDYFLGRYEVTQGQWTAVMGTNPAHAYGVGFTRPVYYVSWDDIAGPGGFIEKLNQAVGSAAFRLPTEAEWEYAARGGTTTEFSFPAPVDWDRHCGSFPEAEPYMRWCGIGWLSGPLEAGENLPNPWGLYDVHGNNWEWVQDLFHPGFAGAPDDGSAWEAQPGALRVVRGGAWNAPASYCRSAARLPLEPGHKCFNTGFRVAMSP